MSFLRGAAVPVLFVLLLTNAAFSNAGETSRFVRSLLAGVDIPQNSSIFAPPPGFNAPQQVHITQGDFEGKAVIVSWITPNTPDVSEVYYGTEKGNYTETATGKMTTYSYYNYTSAFIHHAVIKNLEFDTEYFYQLGQGEVAREFSFFTAPASGPDVPYTFGIIGDLGQTYDSYKTFTHYLQSSGQTLLNVGDLSYADDYPFDYNVRWDTWGRMIEASAAYQPWIWTAGNHEIEFNPSFGEDVPFKPFNHRFRTPYAATNSTDPLFYAIQRGPATIVVLSSYSAYGKYTPQYVWLTGYLPTIDRTVTPWVIVLLHSPWYNSNSYHYMEGETMRVEFEALLNQYSVDIVYAGHVHAYERTYPVSNTQYDIVNGLCTPVYNASSPTYVTIGDGGNIEGLAGIFTQPQPAYSAYREASFGHAEFQIFNRTHAMHTWHRNADGEKVVADSAVVLNTYYT